VTCPVGDYWRDSPGYDANAPQHFNNEMESFFLLYNRYQTEKAKGAKM
jgi:hypothetical protein